MKLVYVNNYFNIEKSFGFTVIKPLDLNNHGGNLALNILNMGIISTSAKEKYYLSDEGNWKKCCPEES
uniref:Uncharacterized protein n=1 Tax=Megaselia scalaris TaxID=36166 RepID=T1H0J5_MEGSC